MLQIQHISKEYRTGNLVQKALDDVSLNLRDNEFVAILGPSGSGKTTLLNVIGGLDRYDKGDLIINGISTKKYKDRDWDSYRNHTIGFVFQSYNLIPHQTILANVELALTISGIGRDERRKRAAEALEKVGLGEQLHKKPNQMSGGQMQRVAIARALVNDPDILLADEPTGALDSDTSVQVMELLREVARDKLVVMVTHNPELAESYATRIVNLRDGKIRSDTDEYQVDETVMEEPEHRNMGKSSMSFLTALSLSFNNLRTKKARTLLTSFAGSIGIIGIAMILALSNGVNAYIQSVEEETLSEYPLQILSTGFDMTSMMAGSMAMGGAGGDGAEEADEIKVVQVMTSMFSQMNSNDLASLKSYLEGEESGVQEYAKAIEYTYGVTPQIYRQTEDGIRQVNPDQSFQALGIGSGASANSLMSSMMSTDVFYELPANKSLYEDQYEIAAGHWPEQDNECVLVTTADGGISDFMLYALGLRDQEELDRMIRQFVSEEEIETPENIGNYSYDDILGTTFKLVNSTDYYEYDEEYQVWKDKTDNDAYMKELVARGEDLEIVGIVRPGEDAKVSALAVGIAYPSSLVEHIAEQASESEIVKQQLADSRVDVFTGEEFGEGSSNTFDMSSLFTIDEAALQDAFGSNEDMLAGLESMNGLDLGQSMDLGSMNLDLSSVSMPDFASVLSGLQITVKPGGLTDQASSLTDGYEAYVKTQGGADYSQMTQHLMEYFLTQEGQDILTDAGKTDAEKVTALTSGYTAYAAAKQYEDPTQMGQDFVAYLRTSDGQERLTEGLMAAIDTDSMAAQLAAAYGSYMTTVMGTYTEAMSQAVQAQMAGVVERLVVQIGNSMQNAMAEAMQIDEQALSSAFQFHMTEEDLTELMLSMSGADGASYEGNLQQLGYIDFDQPAEISIYPKDFENKEKIVEILDAYNQTMEEEGKEDQVISYTDMVGTLMSSVTSIIDTISYVLIAFVAISLVVSSIMIGVITYISVLERKKEIGILRAIGASKGNISQVFNAETIIIGLCAGLMGIGVTLLLLIPGNGIIHHVAGNNRVNAILPAAPAVILILLSVVLTLIGGLIPSKKAAKSDPVTALRTE